MLIDEKNIEKEMLRILVLSVAKNVKNTICHVIISSDEMQAIHAYKKSKLSICWVHPWTESIYLCIFYSILGPLLLSLSLFQTLLLLNVPLEQLSGLSEFFLLQYLEC